MRVIAIAAVAMELMALGSIAVCTAAGAGTTICQATQTSYGSFCSDQTPGAQDAAGYHSLPSWVNLQKPLSSIAVSDNQVWGLDYNATLWYLPNFKLAQTWIKVAAGVNQISAGHNLVCQLNSNSHLYCSASPNPLLGKTDKNGFHAIAWFDAGATTFRQIAVSAGTQIWAIDVNNNLYKISDYTNLANTKIPVAAGVQQVAVDGKGVLCETDFGNNVWCSSWPEVPAAATDWGFYHSLSTWFNTGRQLQNIAVADGKVWGTDSNGNVWLLPDYTNSATWQRIAYGAVGDKLAAASLPSAFTPATFAPGEVAVLLFMGQSNSAGINALPPRFIAPASPNVWGVTNQGWNFIPGNANGTAPFTGPISGIHSVQWSPWKVSPAGPDMNLAYNSGASGNAANFAAYQWQSMINAGMKLPDLYIVHIAWASQGVDPQDNFGVSSIPWLIHGVNLWQPLLTADQQPSYALAPFSRRIVYNALSNLLTSGKTPRLIALQWNQWEAEASNPNPISVTDAPSNYTNLFHAFNTAIGAHIPVQLIQPLSQGYGAAKLSQMQTVFANLVAASPADDSLIDVSQVSSSIFSGGVLGGGDGFVHYNLDTHQWFAGQAVGVCLVQGNCGPRITSLPASPTN